MVNSCAILVGMVPTRLLLEKRRYIMLESLPIDDGIVPVNEFVSRKK
jgi:hypothetical protein